jgi:hypothetical protein
MLLEQVRLYLVSMQQEQRRIHHYRLHYRLYSRLCLLLQQWMLLRGISFGSFLSL